MKTIAFFDVERWEKDYLKKTFPRAKLLFFSDELNNKNVNKIKKADIVSGFITSNFSKEILQKLPNLKYISARSTGFDHIDMAYCKNNNIKVSNVPFYGENTVAEHTFALILALSRRIVGGVLRTREGEFNYEKLRGFDLKGKTIGIVGLGSIGKHIALMAKGFEMKIIAYDPFKDLKFAKKHKIKFTNLNSLLKRADVVTLHVPYMKATHHLINKENIKLMKKEAILINTARGALIDNEALLWMLSRNRLRGVGLDVIEGENLLKDEEEMMSKKMSDEDIRTLLEDHILLEYDNVIVTPHNAFNSKEALIRILNTTVDNIKGFIKGKYKNKVL